MSGAALDNNSGTDALGKKVRALASILLVPAAAVPLRDNSTLTENALVQFVY